MKFNFYQSKLAAKSDASASDLEAQLRNEMAPLVELYKKGEIQQKDIYRLLGTTIKNYETAVISEKLESFRKPVQELTRKISKLDAEFDPSKVLASLLVSLDVAVIPQLKRLYILTKKRTAELFKEILIETPQEEKTWGTFVSDEKTRIIDEVKESFQEQMSKVSEIFGNLTDNEIKVLIRNIPQPANMNKNPNLLNNRFAGIDIYFSTQILEKNPLPDSLPKFLNASNSVFSYLTGIRNKAKEAWYQYMSGMSPTELENLPDPETTLDTDAWKLIEQAGFELSNLIGPLSYWKIEDSSGNTKNFADDQEQTRKVKETVSQGFDDETILYVITDPKELEGNPILNDPNYKRLRMLFRKVLDENREKFKDQLTKAGFQELTQIVEKVDKLKKDPVYADFNLYVRSYKEPKLYGILREDFNLNPVPFETNMKMPNEYPWGNTIKTDFLMPVDVLVQSGKELTIKRKIVFTGEYLEGRKNSKDRQILESEKPYVGPDGKPHQFTTDIAGMSISQNMTRGKSILDIEAYNAKTEWKKVVQPVVSSLLGGSSLYFVEEDTNPPYEKIAKKLDDHYIIYSYAGCNDETCKAMNLLKKSAQANPNSESAEYINNPQKFDTKRKQLDYLEIMKANFLITAVFPRSIQLTTSKSFNTGSMYEHYLYLQKLNEEENALFQRYDPNNEQIVSRLEEIHRQKDSLENSPLYDIKQKFDDLKTSKRYARVLENFDYLADIVKNSEISDVDLRVKVNDLVNGINVSSIRSFAERVRLIKKYASS